MYKNKIFLSQITSIIISLCMIFFSNNEIPIPLLSFVYSQFVHFIYI